MNVKQTLENAVGTSEDIHLDDIDVDPPTIKAILINEVVPFDASRDFHGVPGANYLKTTIPLMQGAGAQVTSTQDVLQLGIYIADAVKTPKTDYAIDKSSIEKSLPYLEQGPALFPSVKVIMLMDDIVKKAFNMVTKKTTKKSVVPAISTYRLRNSQLYYGDIRTVPFYIMIGDNILIEEPRVTMATEDIADMLEIIKS